MRVQEGLETNVLPDGQLEFFQPRTGVRHRCGPAGAAVWIALQQQEWRLAPAAETLSAHWGVCPESVRCDIDAWLGHFRATGLIRGPD